MLRNAIALKLGSLLGLPFTNSFIPVNLVINGKYRGAYMVTEKIGINSGSVDIDEEKGILFEMDTYYDEDMKFISPGFGLPVMIKDPDFAELHEEISDYPTPDESFAKWREDFSKMENLLISINVNKTDEDLVNEAKAEFLKKFDLSSFVDYILVYDICRNSEISWPKSTYLYKKDISDKYHMGPIWDFDWAFPSNNSQSKLLAIGDDFKGTQFVISICEFPEFRELFSQRWSNFEKDIYPELIRFIDDYAKTIRVSALQNGMIWPEGKYSGVSIGSSADIDKHVETLKEWLEIRKNAISEDSNWLLF